MVYCRISKDRTGAGLGVDSQEHECRELAAASGLTVREVYADNDISASKYTRKKRPGYRKMLSDLEANPATVICWHNDRLIRQPRELEDYIDLVEKHGILTHTVRAGEFDLATSSGRMVARMLGAAAAHEVEHMSERACAAKDRAVREGTLTGSRRPFGFEPGGRTIRATEAAEVVTMATAVLGGASVRSVVRDLNHRGVRTATGAPWTPKAVRQVLLRPRNAGLQVHLGEVAGRAAWGRELGDGQWGCLLGEDDWRRLCTIINATKTGDRGPWRRWLGSGLYHCGVCGRPSMIVRGRAGNGHPCYRCVGDGEVEQHVSRDAIQLDAYVTHIVLGWLARYGAAALVPPDRSGESAALHAQAAGIREELKALAVIHGRGDISAEQLALSSRGLHARLGPLEQRIAAATGPGRASVIARAQDPAGVWHEATIEERQAVVAALMTVTVLPVPKGRPKGTRNGEPYFRTECIDIAFRHPGGQAGQEPRREAGR